VRRSREGSSCLVKASANTTFDILFKKAEKEGRVGGKYRCRICGMSHRNEQDAVGCCEKLIERQQR